ncbi:hypothetical protein U1Q18_045605 [Sarracenia purpurea var. burkii]
MATGNDSQSSWSLGMVMEEGLSHGWEVSICLSNTCAIEMRTAFQLAWQHTGFTCYGYAMLGPCGLATSIDSVLGGICAEFIGHLIGLLHDVACYPSERMGFATIDLNRLGFAAFNGHY